MSPRAHPPRLPRSIVLATVLAFVTPLLVLTVGAAPADAARLNLHRGSHGTKVKLVETRLNRIGLLLASAVDRRYRAATVNAVKRFQRQHRLRVNGRVNRRTWNLVAREAARRSLPPAPSVIAHRGAVRTWMPENTLQSLRFAHGYADVLEFDLRLTADHEIVLMHDATLDRTTNCTGPVASWTLADLRAQCRVGSQPVPTFSEVAAYAAGVAEAIAPEVKDADINDEDLGRVLDVLAEHGLTSRTYLQSFYPAVLERLHAMTPGLMTVRVSNTPPTVADVKAVGATRVAVRMKNLSAAQVKVYKRYGLEVWAFTAVDKAGLLAARTRGVNAIVTDIPRTAVSYYRQ